jgi:hypothetical protein
MKKKYEYAVKSPKSMDCALNAAGAAIIAPDHVWLAPSNRMSFAV